MDYSCNSNHGENNVVGIYANGNNTHTVDFGTLDAKSNNREKCRRCFGLHLWSSDRLPRALYIVFTSHGDAKDIDGFGLTVHRVDERKESIPLVVKQHDLQLNHDGKDVFAKAFLISPQRYFDFDQGMCDHCDHGLVCGNKTKCSCVEGGCCALGISVSFLPPMGIGLGKVPDTRQINCFVISQISGKF